MKNITGKELYNKINEDCNLVILDVRDKEDYEKGHIKNSITMAQDEVAHEIENIVQEKDIPICVYCYSGNRSRRVAMILEYLGYEQVYNLGGIDKWNYDLEK